MSISTSLQSWSGLTIPHHETNPVRKLSHLVGQREAMNEKIRSTRAKTEYLFRRDDHLHSKNSPQTRSAWIDKLDSILCHPEQFKYQGMRALVHAAKHVEELGETIADLSGMIERLVKNVLSRGKTANTAQVFAAGVGRTTTMLLTAPGFAVHKALGAALYGLSCGLSIVALLAAVTPVGRKRSATDMQQRYSSLINTSNNNKAPQDTLFTRSAVKECSRLLLSIKEKSIKTLLNQAETHPHRGANFMRALAQRLSRKIGEYGPSSHHIHCYDSSYIWGHLHQYGPITRTMMSSAHLVYTAVNRLGASFDKYLGSSLGHIAFNPLLGRIMGQRLGMLCSTSLATAISVALAPFIIGISATGAMACGLTLLLMQASTLCARIEGWKGDIQPFWPNKHVKF